MNNTVKATLVILLTCFSLQSFGAKIYLSPTGSDKNKGTTPETAVKTFSKALTIAKSRDIIPI